MEDSTVASQLDDVQTFAREDKEEKIFLVPISDIVITHRQRKIDINDKEWIDHVDRLASSIQRVGLMHPITLDDESNELVAGFCRIQAHMKLGRTHILARRRSSIDPLEKKVMELEENIQRLGLAWWMKAAAISEIHELQQRLHPDWSQRKTAEMVGESVGTINQAIQVASEIKKNPTVVKEAKTAQAALNKIRFEKQLEKRKEEVKLKEAGKLPTFMAEIRVGDALELIRAEPDASFDAVITNFPFGIDLTMGKDGKKPYHDEEDYIVKLVRAVTHESYRVLKDDSWMVAWFDVRKITYSNKHLELVKALMQNQGFAESPLADLAAESLGLTYWMEEAGFDYVTLMPSVWVKPNKTQGMIGDPKKGLITAYEAFVFAGKGDPFLLKRGLQNIFIYDTPLAGERVHPLQMSFELTKQIVSMVCMGRSRVLDPFAGSGSVGVGALENQCEFVGFELDPKKAENGNLLLREHIAAAPAKEA